MSHRTHLRHGAGLALAATLLLPALAACGSSGSSASDTSSSGSTASTTAPEASGTDAASGDTVNIKLIAYKPGTLSVAAGSSVTWHQMDPGVHTVTAGTVTQTGGTATTHPDGTFDSGELATGKSFTEKFDTPGTYTYFCKIHPATMHGEITVK
jgi:plastocyanin